MNRGLRNSMVCLVLLSAVFKPAWASESSHAAIADTLSGLLISNINLDARPFIISGDLCVPPGATVKIAKGTVFLFESFSGLHVQGTLLAQGTPGEPIIFTSKNDRAWNPDAAVDAAPFDWNGIDIEESAIGTVLSECEIRYSVYGIKSKTGFFKLDNVKFALNGKSDLNVKDIKQEIDIQPYSYGATQSNSALTFHELKKNAELRMKFRYSGLAFALAGCAVGSWALSEYPAAQKKFDEINTPDSEGVLPYTTSHWNSVKRTRDRNLALLLLGWGICFVGATGFIVTFTF